MTEMMKFAPSRAPGEQYHVHMNIFMAALPCKIQKLVSETSGTTVKKCTIHQTSGINPLWITTRKFNNEQDTKKWFEEVKAMLHELKSNSGYVEYEKVQSDKIFKQKYVSYQPILEFPDLAVKKSSKDQTCDIHIFMPIEDSNELLLHKLEQAGFYEVRTKDQRIWTLLLSDRKKGENYFSLFKEYFARAGGITKLELEYVQSISATKNNFLREQVFA